MSMARMNPLEWGKLIGILLIILFLGYFGRRFLEVFDRGVESVIKAPSRAADAVATRIAGREETFGGWLHSIFGVREAQVKAMLAGRYDGPNKLPRGAEGEF